MDFCPSFLLAMAATGTGGSLSAGEMKSWCVTLALFVTLTSLWSELVHSWYLPGATSHNYKKNDLVAINVSSVTSTMSVRSYPFYSLPTCKLPTAELEEFNERRHNENIADILWGEQIRSLYVVQMKVNRTCRKLCDTLTIDHEDKNILDGKIELLYKSNLMLHGLSAAYPLGVPKRFVPKGTKDPFINNHLNFVIGYTQVGQQMDPSELKYHVVFFNVTAASIKWEDDASGCVDGEVVDMSKYSAVTTGDGKVTYTYSITWIEDPTVVSRWDRYLQDHDGKKKP